MEQESYVSTARMVASLLWAAVIAMIGTAWILLATGDETSRRFAYMLAVTGCTTSAAAAVAHIRVYALSISKQIRVSAGLYQNSPSGPSEGAGLRSVH